MSQISEIKFRYTSGHFMFAHKFFWGKEHFMCPVKKRQKNVVNNLVWERIFFTRDTKNVNFCRKLMWEHRMSRCSSEILFQNFLTFTNVFSHNGFICTREPDWISVSFFVKKNQNQLPTTQWSLCIPFSCVVIIVLAVESSGN